MPHIPYQIYFGEACAFKAKTIGSYSLDLDEDGDVIITAPESLDEHLTVNGDLELSDGERASKKPKLDIDGMWTVRASSKHLRLASKVFKAMFARIWKSGDTFPVHFPIPDPHHEALTILFKLIHGLNSDIPTNVTPLVLARMADYVDYFDLMHVIPGVLRSSWMRSVGTYFPGEEKLLRKPKEVQLEEKCTTLLAPWLCIYRVFGTEKDLSWILSTAKRCYNEDFTQFRFQVPVSYAESIQKQREIEMSAIVEVCSRVLEELRNTSSEADGCVHDMIVSLHFAKLHRWMLHQNLIRGLEHFTRQESLTMLLNELQHFESYWRTYQTQIQDYASDTGYHQHEHSWRMITKDMVKFAQKLSKKTHEYTYDELVENLWERAHVTSKYRRIKSKDALPSRGLLAVA